MVLWGKPKRQILREFDSRELSELQLFRRIEPWGGEWENLRAGTIATAAAGANPLRKPCNVPKPGDWFRRARAEVQSEEEIRAVAEAAAKRFAAYREQNRHG